MVKRVRVAVASGRGVAERWRSQYQRDGKWTRTVTGDSEVIYNKLCDLGPNPNIDAIADLIGNKGWVHLTCSACSEYVTRAADFGCDYSDNQLLLCQACLTDGTAALSATER
jgi:hypothetical protein